MMVFAVDIDEVRLSSGPFNIEKGDEFWQKEMPLLVAYRD